VACSSANERKECMSSELSHVILVGASRAESFEESEERQGAELNVLWQRWWEVKRRRGDCHNRGCCRQFQVWEVGEQGCSRSASVSGSSLGRRFGCNASRRSPQSATACQPAPLPCQDLSIILTSCLYCCLMLAVNIYATNLYGHVGASTFSSTMSLTSALQVLVRQMLDPVHTHAAR
jgi:hypothetical protein